MPFITHNFSDLSIKERAAVSFEDLKTHFLPFKLMEAGVSRLPEPVPQVVPAQPEVSAKTAYELIRGQYHDTAIVFDSAEALMSFVALNPRHTEEDYYLNAEFAGMDVKKIVDEVFSIKPVSVVDPATFDRMSRWAREAKKIREQNEADAKAWTKSNEAADEVWSELCDSWRSACQAQAKVNEILATYAEYQSLTKGADFVAYSFLIKRYSYSEISAAFEEAGIEIPTEPVASSVEAQG